MLQYKMYPAGELAVLRQLLFDVSIVIGQQHIDARKCVLAAGSDYFNTLLIGSFKDSTMTEIDLSEVMNDAVSFEAVVNFLCSGEIEVEDDSLSEIVKLSSYLLISQLQDMCTMYLLENLNLSTCLKYYLHSVQYGLRDLEHKAVFIVKSRFHDHILAEEKTLEVSENERLHFSRNGFFEYCSIPNLLCFLARRIGLELTEI